MAHLRKPCTVSKSFMRQSKVQKFTHTFSQKEFQMQRLKMIIPFFSLPCRFLIAKMLEWREREHEDDEFESLNDMGTVNALRQCGLLNFFKIHGMRAQLRLLEYLVHMWDVDQQVFDVGVHVFHLRFQSLVF